MGQRRNLLGLQIRFEGGIVRSLLLLLLGVMVVQAQPPVPPVTTNIVRRPNIIMTVMTVTNPANFEIIDSRFTNWIASVTFGWDTNREPDIAGYRLYQGNRSRTYTNVVSFGLTNAGTMVNISRTNRNYFALTAFNTAGIESEFSSELIWPNPPIPAYYTNFVVVLPYQFSTNSSGPWITYTARLHYVSQTNGSMFWRSMPIQIERSP